MARIIDGNSMNLVGAKVRELRRSRRMSQQALSAQLELRGIYVCRGSVSRLEDGLRTVTDIELFALAQIFQVSIDSLFEH